MNNLRGGDSKPDNLNNNNDRDPMEWSPAPKKREPVKRNNTNLNTNSTSSNTNPTNRLKKNKWGNDPGCNNTNQGANNNKN